jgi:hypothetical protein
MDSLTHYRQIVEQVLTQHLEINYANGTIQNEPIFDREAGRFVIISSGWQGARRIHGCLMHINIQDGKVWIQYDGTKHGIANELVAAGIPRDQIVLGFYSSATRQYTDFAVA